MPIRWSALRVSEAMDEIEGLIDLAQPFFDQAKAKAREAKTIPNLPGYMDNRLSRLIWDIDRIEAVRRAITTPQGRPRGSVTSGAQYARAACTYLTIKAGTMG